MNVSRRFVLIKRCTVRPSLHSAFCCFDGFKFVEAIINIFVDHFEFRAVSFYVHSVIVRGWACAAIAVMPTTPAAINSEDLKKNLMEAPLPTS